MPNTIKKSKKEWCHKQKIHTSLQIRDHMWSIHLCLGTEEYDCRHLQKLSLQAGRFDTNATIFYTMHRRKKVYYVYETRVRAWVIKYKHVVGRRYFSQLFAETTGRMLSCRCMNFRRFRILRKRFRHLLSKCCRCAGALRRERQVWPSGTLPANPDFPQIRMQSLQRTFTSASGMKTWSTKNIPSTISRLNGFPNL